jgi:hypothetical protein
MQAVLQAAHDVSPFPIFRNNLYDIDNVYHTDFVYHSDVIIPFLCFIQIFLLPSQRTGTHLVVVEEQTSSRMEYI